MNHYNPSKRCMLYCPPGSTEYLPDCHLIDSSLGPSENMVDSPHEPSNQVECSPGTSKQIDSPAEPPKSLVDFFPKSSDLQKDNLPGCSKRLIDYFPKQPKRPNIQGSPDYLAAILKKPEAEIHYGMKSSDNTRDLTKMSRYLLLPNAIKKCPTEDQKSEKVAISSIPSASLTINDLPNEVLAYIFEFLSIQERVEVRNVCKKWNQLLRSDVMWTRVIAKDISPAFFIKLLQFLLPRCVAHLRLECRAEALPISLPEFLAKIHEKCPSLKSLAIENCHLIKNLHSGNGYDTRSLEGFNARLLQEAISKLKGPDLQVIRSEFRKEEGMDIHSAALTELRTFSLRSVLFNQLHLYSCFSSTVFPKIVVLDFSYSRPVSMTEINDELFSTLTSLEELYLAGWGIKDHNIMKFIQNAKKLRILDLELSYVTDSIVSALKANCVRLEGLYLSHTEIGDIYRENDEKVFFPHLQSLCVKYTKATEEGVDELLRAYPSLKVIDVSSCDDVSEEWYFDLPADVQSRVLFDFDDEFYCDHIQQTKYTKSSSRPF